MSKDLPENYWPKIYPRDSKSWRSSFQETATAVEVYSKQYDLSVISIIDIANHVWDWLCTVKETPEYQVPAIIVPKGRPINPFSDKPDHNPLACVAYNNYTLPVYDDDTNSYEYMNYQLYPIVRIYYGTFRHYLEDQLTHMVSGIMEVPPAFLEAVITCIILHEFVHVINYRNTVKQYYDDNNAIQLKQRIAKHNTSFESIGSDDDEFNSEERVINLALWYFSNLQPIVGGRYDLFMRKRSPIWDSFMSGIDYYIASSRFSHELQTLYNHKISGSDLKSRMIARYRHENTHWLLVP